MTKLVAVSALSPDDVWAVGTKDPHSSGGVPTSRIAHFDGSGWTSVAHPQPGGAPNGDSLAGVAALSPSDVWAVGSVGAQQPLVEHFDGSQWVVVTTPTQPGVAVFSAVSAISPNDVWAVGVEIQQGVQSGLIEHWDGSTWTVVPSQTTDWVTAVSASSTTDVWAVTPKHVLHWNGSAWSSVETAGVGDDLASITAVAPNDVWAVGLGRGAHTAPVYVLHWDGRAWKHVTTPGLQFAHAQLTGVSASSATDVWAVGWGLNRRAHRDQMLIEHFDGTAWSVVNASSKPRQRFLYAVSARAGNDAWAVGMQNDRPFAEHWDGSSWSHSHFTR